MDRSIVKTSKGVGGMKKKRQQIMHNRLYLERKQLGITQQEMSEALDVYDKTYHLKESGSFRFCEDEMAIVQDIINKGREERGESRLSLEELFETSQLVGRSKVM